MVLKVLFLKESTFMHKPTLYHPENPRRAVEARSALTSEGISIVDISIQGVDIVEAQRLAKRVHSIDYVELLGKLSKRAPVDIDEDTYMSRDTLELALAYFYEAYRSATESRRVFILGRPPGHHVGYNGATPGVATQGFCILNNAAAAVHGFMDAGYRRLLTIDFDAHHGNGTMEIFYKQKVLQVDFHQDPATLYPYTGYSDELGEGEGYGYKVNIVLPRYSGDDLFLELLEMIKQAINRYSPEAVVVSAGFDAFENDGLSDLALTEISYYQVGRFIAELDVPTVAVLEGGYGVGLRRGLVAFIKGLKSEMVEYPLLTTTPTSARRASLESAKRVIEKVVGRIYGA